jgi:lipoic acid synthetase
MATVPTLDGARRPEWLKVRLPGGGAYQDLVGIVRTQTLHTVCEEARCPNIGECWGRRTATFLILGNLCTRNCAYCAIAHGLPTELDVQEPERVARAVAAMGLHHAVITSVNRDDLADGGAGIYAQTIRRIREILPGCTVEVLIPDFKGDAAALRTVLDADPEILGHNIESVRRVFKIVRHGGSYDRSLELLRRVKEWGYTCFTKSGIILGMGETWEELLQTMDDLRAVDVDVLTLGQYLRPGPDYHPIERYYTPEEFRTLREEGLRRGFKYVESGPLVRSSYHADDQARAVLAYRSGLRATPV